MKQLLKHLWIKARQYPKVVGAGLLLVVVGAVWIIARIAAGRKGTAVADDGSLTKAIDFAPSGHSPPSSRS